MKRDRKVALTVLGTGLLAGGLVGFGAGYRTGRAELGRLLSLPEGSIVLAERRDGLFVKLRQRVIEFRPVPPDPYETKIVQQMFPPQPSAAPTTTTIPEKGKELSR